LSILATIAAPGSNSSSGAPQTPGLRHDGARYPVTAGQKSFLLQLLDLVFHGGDGLQPDRVTDFPEARGNAVTFRITLDETQDLLLPPGEHWVGLITSPSSASHPPSPPRETGFAPHMIDDY
jgi:hypothetical protein